MREEFYVQGNAIERAQDFHKQKGSRKEYIMEEVETVTQAEGLRTKRWTIRKNARLF